jgi:iron complex outermembrane recepter protein
MHRDSLNQRGPAFRRRVAAAAAPMVFAGLLMCAAVPPSPSNSTAKDAKKPSGKSEVTVTTPRMTMPLKETPASVSVVTPQTLRNMPRAFSADEALDLVPGVRVENQYDGEVVHLYIRGQGVLSEHGLRNITVLLDGIPLDDPTGFVRDLFDVDWSTVKRVEVLKGPSGALYGGGASGGVVSIRTQDGPPKQGVEAFFTGGSHGFLKAMVEDGGTQGALNYRVAAARTLGDGYRDHTAFHATNLYGKFHWQASPRFEMTALVYGVGHFNEIAEGLNAEQVDQNPVQANPDAAAFNEYQKTRRITAGLTGRVALTTRQNLSFSAYGRKTRYREAVPSSVDHATYTNPGAMFQWNLMTGKGHVRNHAAAGIDASWQTIDEYAHPNMGGAVEGPALLSDETIHQGGGGVYVMDKVSLGSAWTVMASLRRDRIYQNLEDHLALGGDNLSGAADFSKTTGRFGAAWSPLPSLSVYADWGQGFTPPSTEELLNNPAHIGGFNQSMSASTSRQVEAGARGTAGGSLYYDAAVFRMTTDNDFQRYRVPSRPLETFYRNTGATRRTGLELYLAWHPLTDLAVRTAYTYSDFIYTSYEPDAASVVGGRLPNIPEHMASLDVQYTPGDHWIVGGGFRLQNRLYVDPANTVWTGGYTLFNARLAYRWTGKTHAGEIMLSGRNLLDKNYIAFTEPDPDGNYFQPGPGREVFLGIRLRFGGFAADPYP